MKDVLFLPLNSNHVLIFSRILEHMGTDVSVETACFDRISESAAFHTEPQLKGLGIPYSHLPRGLVRNGGGGTVGRVRDFFRMRGIVRSYLDGVRPKVLVLAIDNDPIARIFIDGCRRLGGSVALVQEALVRPFELGDLPSYRSDPIHRVLAGAGIHLRYERYGCSRPDRILASGPRAKRIFTALGMAAESVVITGQPKYDGFIVRAKSHRGGRNSPPRVLYAAPSDLLSNPVIFNFMERAADAAAALGARLTLKLHPRAPHGPEALLERLSSGVRPWVDIVTKGDDTFDLLAASDIFVTVSSTVVLEALLLDRECLVADYIAGRQRLDYGSYGAVHVLNREEDILPALRAAVERPTSGRDKVRLLEDELFRLDGRSGMRTALAIREMLAPHDRG